MKAPSCPSCPMLSWKSIPLEILSLKGKGKQQSKTWGWKSKRKIEIYNFVTLHTKNEILRIECEQQCPVIQCLNRTQDSKVLLIRIHRGFGVREFTSVTEKEGDTG